MSAQAFEQLQVLMTGVDAAIARDVARLIVAEGGRVVAADKEAAKLTRLERDLGLYRTSIETAQIDLGNQADVRLWEASLGAARRLPHLMICCCGSPAEQLSRPKSPRQITQLHDVSLGEHRARNCPALIAERVLQPALFLHAEPMRRTAFDRALAVVRHPTLRGVLARAPGRSVFNPASLIPYVRIASHVYSMRRLPDGEMTKGGRLRLAPPTDKPSGRANAA
jgi:hypothetical protein